MIGAKNGVESHSLKMLALIVGNDPAESDFHLPGSISKLDSTVVPADVNNEKVLPAEAGILSENFQLRDLPSCLPSVPNVSSTSMVPSSDWPQEECAVPGRKPEVTPRRMFCSPNYPHRTEPIPPHILTEDIVRFWPNHLYGETLLKVSCLFGPREISKMQSVVKVGAIRRRLKTARDAAGITSRRQKRRRVKRRTARTLETDENIKIEETKSCLRGNDTTGLICQQLVSKALVLEIEPGLVHHNINGHHTRRKVSKANKLCRKALEEIDKSLMIKAKVLDSTFDTGNAAHDKQILERVWQNECDRLVNTYAKSEDSPVITQLLQDAGLINSD